MRPKGWKLDPLWVEHYARKEEASLKRQIEAIKFQMQTDQWRAEAQAHLRAMKSARLV